MVSTILRATSLFAIRGISETRPSAAMSVTLLVSVRNPAPLVAERIESYPVKSFSHHLARCVFSLVVGLQGESDQRLIRSFELSETCGYVRVFDKLDGHAVPLLTFYFLFSAFCRSVVGHGRAEYGSVAFREHAFAGYEHFACAYHVDSFYFPSGVGRLTGPATSLTFAPKSLRALARAKPIFPLEWLPIKRTGSMFSYVGPAVTRYVFLQEVYCL